MLRTAEAFAGLGDREILEQCIRFAEGLATESRSPGAHDRVRALRERWAAPGANAASLRQE